MSFLKKIVVSTLAAVLIFASVPFIGVFNTNSNEVYAAGSYGDAASRIANLYDMLEPEELPVLREARGKVAAGVFDALENNPYIRPDLTPGQKTALSDFFTILASLPYSYSESTLEELFGAIPKGTIKGLFSDDVTSADVFAFIIQLESNLTAGMEGLNFTTFISDGIKKSLQNKVEQALISTFNHPDFTAIKAGLYSVFNDHEAEEGLREVLKSINTYVDPNSEAQIALGLAYIRTLATPNPVAVKENNSFTFDLGIAGNNLFNLGSAIQSSVVDNSGNASDKVEFEIVENGLNKTGKLTAVNAKSGETYKLKLFFEHDRPYLVAKVNINITSVGGSGSNNTGGGETTPTPSTPQAGQVKVEEKVATNAAGQSVNTVSVKVEDLLAQAGDGKAPVNLVLTATQNADVVVASIPLDAINKLNVSNPNHAVTLNTPAGAVTLTVAQLSQALLAAAANGIDAVNTQLEIVFEKGSASANNALKNELGDSSEALTGLMQTKVVVKSGDKSYEVTEYENYVNSTVVLDGEYDPNQLVGVDYNTTLGASSKASSVVVSATVNGFGPVPTQVIVKDGKTTVTLMKMSNAPFTVVKSSKKFADVSNQWFAADVTLLANKLIVKGVKEDQFAPNNTLTRAEFATMIVRALGLPEDIAKGASFSDVKVTDWYAGAIGAAAKAGVIQGVGDNKFNPTGYVTRQEVAKMVVAAIKYAGGSVPAADKAALAKFSDADQVSSWAYDAVAVAASKGILKGVDGKVNPLGNASRAEAAAFIKRFMQDVKFITE